MEKIASLSGIKVLDLSRMLPGPYCSMILADHGAEVIAIEERRFEADGLFNETLNRNKRHLTLNLKSPEGKDIFFKLAETADILIEGFRPGVVERLGVDYQSVRRITPGIIYCSITGYGQTGPFRLRPGHDINYLGTAGLLDLIGPSAAPPSIPGVQFADIAGGSLQAVIGILLALYERTHSGLGQYIDISMTDGLIGLLNLPMLLSKDKSAGPQRSDELLSHRYACYNTYETADGGSIAVGALENRFWKRLCQLLDLSEFENLQYDAERREEIIARFGQRFRERPADEWERLLAAEDTCCSRVIKPKEVLNHPLFVERGMVLPAEQAADGDDCRLGIPVKLSRTPGTLRTPAVGFGGSTREILGELGYSADQIGDLERRGIV